MDALKAAMGILTFSQVVSSLGCWRGWIDEEEPPWAGVVDITMRIYTLRTPCTKYSRRE